MGIVLDFIMISVLLVFGIIGSFKGFFKSFITLLGTGLSILLTYLFRNQLLQLDKSIGIGSMLGLSGNSAGDVLTIVIYGVILFILLRIIALLLNMTVGKIFKGKVLSPINKTLGFILEFLKSGIAILGILFAVSGAMMIDGINTIISSNIQDSFLVRPIINYLKDDVIANHIKNDDADNTNSDANILFIEYAEKNNNQYNSANII